MHTYQTLKYLKDLQHNAPFEGAVLVMFRLTVRWGWKTQLLLLMMVQKKPSKQWIITAENMPTKPNKTKNCNTSSMFKSMCQDSKDLSEKKGFSRFLPNQLLSHQSIRWPIWRMRTPQHWLQNHHEDQHQHHSETNSIVGVPWLRAMWKPSRFLINSLNLQQLWASYKRYLVWNSYRFGRYMWLLFLVCFRCFMMRNNSIWLYIVVRSCMILVWECLERF